MVDRSLNYGRHLIADFVRGLDVRVALDLGPGQGDDIRAVRAAHPGARIVGLESYPPYVERLRAAGFEVLSADIERDRLPFDDGMVDLIVANQILEHVKELFWILHECARTLRVGGSIVIGVPNLAAFHNRALLAIGRQPSPMKNWSAHVRGYTKSDLVQTIDKPFPGGFVLRRSGGANFYPLPGAIAKVAARAWPGGAWGLFTRFEKVRPYEGSYLRWAGEQQLETKFYLGPASEPGSGTS
jgi:SAM-dependent methyltransferase